MRSIPLAICAGLAGILTPALAAAQEQCEAIASEISAIEGRLDVSRSREARGLFSGLVGAAAQAAPYASVGGGPVADAVAAQAQSTVSHATVDAIRGDDAPAEASGDVKADRARLKQLRREAKMQGCR
jgi:hypothetical protein